MQTIQDLFNEIGMSEDERREEMQILNSSISKIKSGFISATLAQYQNLKSEIEQVKNNHIKLLEIMGRPQHKIDRVRNSGKEGNLKQNLDNVNNAFLPVYNAYMNEIIMYNRQILEYYDILDVREEDRIVLITDFDQITQTTVSHLEEELNSLSKQVEEMNEKAKNIITEIKQLKIVLNEKIPEAIALAIDQKPIKKYEFDLISDYMEMLTKTKESREKMVAELAIEITNLWNTLEVGENERQIFLNSHFHLAEDDINACINLIKFLKDQRNDMIQSHIDKASNEVVNICKQLKFSDERKDSIFQKIQTLTENNNGKEDPQVLYFEYLGVELAKLKRMLIIVEPINELIQKRESIKREYNAIKENNMGASKQEKKDIRSNNDPGSLFRIEKITRRFKYVLPRIEKTLSVALSEYKDETGEDFEWENSEDMEQLKKVPISAPEKRLARVSLSRIRPK